MEKYNSIKDFCAAENITKEDLKDIMLRSAIDLGCNCVNNFEGSSETTERVFLALHYFHCILRDIE